MSAAWPAWKTVGWGPAKPGERFRNPNHLYSEDLDLFGKGSLFRTAVQRQNARW